MLPEILKEYNSSLDLLTKNLSEIKELLKNESKSKPIEFKNLVNTIINFNSNFDNKLPKFKQNTQTFCFFIQNLVKLSKKILQHIAELIRSNYQKSSKDEKELKEAKRTYENVEMDLKTSLKQFTVKNKEFVKAFSMILQVFFTVEEIILLQSNISKNDKNTVFAIYSHITPGLKNFFRIVWFLEVFDDGKKSQHELKLLTDDIRLPELKKIDTKESSFQENEIENLSLGKKSISSYIRKDEWDFEEMFKLLYKVQDSMKFVILSFSVGKSPSIYRILFQKSQMNNINIFLKMEYIRFDVNNLIK